MLLNEDILIGISRFELKWSKITGPGITGPDLECEAIHQITLQDLLAAIRNMRDTDITCDTFAKEWFLPVSVILPDKLGLDAARRPDIDMPNPYKGKHAMDLLPQEDYQAFEAVFVWLEQLYYEMCMAASGGTGEELAGPLQRRFGISDSVHYMYPGQRLDEIFDLDYLIEYLTCYIHSQGLPMIDREFPDLLKERLIRFFEEDFNLLDQATDEERYLYTRFVEDLMEKDNVTAYIAKGYGSFVGNSVFPCDWEASKECMLRLLDMGDNLQAANILGLLYYEGKLNGGDPDYKEAFYYFSMAAAGGVEESALKLGDMYLYGAYVHKNAGMSAHLYEYIYDKSLKHMKAGEISMFPEAAYRMGIIQMNHIPGMNKPREAFTYFIEARTSLEDRRRMIRHHGDDQLAEDIQSALDRVKYLLDYPVDQKYVILKKPILLEMLCREGYRINMDWVSLDVASRTDSRCQEIYKDIVDKFPDAGMIYRIRSARTRRHGDRNVGKILVNIHELSYSKLVSSVTLFAVDVREIRSLQYPGSNRIRYDSVFYDEDTGRCEFFYDDTLAGYIAGGRCFFYPDFE